MKKIEDYLEHARECREMARRAHGPGEREMLLNMAGTWTTLAENRAQTLKRRERIQRFYPKSV